MKNQRKAWLAAGLLALGAAACFSDPTSDLRSGAVALTTNFATVSVAAGDSVTLIGVVRDAQGNPLPVGTVSWTSADPNVAVANVDTIAKAPGDIFTRAYVRGISNQAGVTTVSVSAQGVTTTVRVTVLPKTFPGTVSVTGTVAPDTVILNRPAPQLPLVTPYAAGDTLVLDATPTVTFNPTNSTVTFGAFPGYIVSRTATQIKAIARQPFAGKVTVTNLIYAGDATTGPVAIASLQTDSVAVQHGRFRGPVAIAASAFGPNTQMTITAPAGVTFVTDTSGHVDIGGTQAIVLTRAATVYTAIIAANITGTLAITNASIGTVKVDSLRSGTPITVNASFFPGTVTNPGGGLLDTIIISGAGNATFTTSGAAASTVTVGGVATMIVSRTSTTIKVFANFGANGPVVITNPIVAGVTIPSLQTQAATSVSGTVTNEPNEPANNAPGGAVFTMGLTASPSILFGAGNTATDPDDYWTFTLATAATVTLRLDFGGTANNPDFDMWVRNAANTAYVGTFAGATAANPENLVLANLPAGTYHIVVDAYDTHGVTALYKLTASHP